MLNTFNLILICGVLAVWAISNYAERLIQRSSGELDADTLNRVLLRSTRADWLWRAPQFLGFVVMLSGMLSNWGVVRITAYPFTALAVGLGLYCLGSIIRTWKTQRAFCVEAPGSNACRSAFTAAVIISVAEIGLGGGITYYLTQNVKRKPAAAVAKKTAAKAGQGSPGKKAASLWGSEAEAMALLEGKEEWYFKAIVQREKIRTKNENGNTLYHLQDIEATVDAGLIDAAELKKEIDAAVVKEDDK